MSAAACALLVGGAARAWAQSPEDDASGWWHDMSTAGNAEMDYGGDNTIPSVDQTTVASDVTPELAAQAQAQRLAQQQQQQALLDQQRNYVASTVGELQGQVESMQQEINNLTDVIAQQRTAMEQYASAAQQAQQALAAREQQDAAMARGQGGTTTAGAAGDRGAAQTGAGTAAAAGGATTAGAAGARASGGPSASDADQGYGNTGQPGDIENEEYGIEPNGGGAAETGVLPEHGYAVPDTGNATTNAPATNGSEGASAPEASQGQ